MYIQKFNRNNGGVISTSTVLVESYRENGKQKRRTIANLSKVPAEYVAEFKKVIKGGLVRSLSDMKIEQGKSFGALYVLNHIANEIGLNKVLGNTKMGKLALLQVLNKIISPTSRLGILKSWAPHQGIEEVIGLSDFSLDDLYTNLEWLSKNQQQIEDTLFVVQEKKASTIYLYDVTSSYFEGQYNELAPYGYNRDGKKGKKQLVIGLLTDSGGDPFSIEVFEGNTNDTKTFGSQLKKLEERFGVKHVVCVGDKGMIKSAQIEAVETMGFHYITSITKAQIKTLIKKDCIQLTLFDEELVEVEAEAESSASLRYILRKNPIREQEMKSTRKQKLIKLQQHVDDRNNYLDQHPKAKVETATKHIGTWISKLKLTKYVSCAPDKKGKLILHIDQKKKEEIAQLDGCYVLKTDVSKQDASKEIIHQRYKDLIKVEYAFRTLKTTLIELRPIFLRKDERTRGHVFACMLAYKIVKALMDKFEQGHNYTKEHIINALDKIQYNQYSYGKIKVKSLPDQLLPDQKAILDTLNIRLPRSL